MTESRVTAETAIQGKLAALPYLAQQLAKVSIAPHVIAIALKY